MVGTGEGANARQFVYGVFAAEVRFQAPRGMHGAFWLQSNGTPEIDIAEYFGDGRGDGGISHFLHPTSTGIGKVGGINPVAARLLTRNGRTPADGFHVYSVEWTSGGYVFRIDGRETMRTTKLRSSDPHFLVMSLLASDAETPMLDRRRMAEAYMDVDWVRVWQR